VYCPPENLQHWEVAKTTKRNETEPYVCRAVNARNGTDTYMCMASKELFTCVEIFCPSKKKQTGTFFGMLYIYVYVYKECVYAHTPWTPMRSCAQNIYTQIYIYTLTKQTAHLFWLAAGAVDLPALSFVRASRPMTPLVMKKHTYIYIMYVYIYLNMRVHRHIHICIYIYSYISKNKSIYTPDDPSADISQKSALVASYRVK